MMIEIRVWDWRSIVGNWNLRIGLGIRIRIIDRNCGLGLRMIGF